MKTKDQVYGTYGVDEVIAERRRQVEVKGYNKEHDSKHDYFELLQAAQCYISIGPKETITLLYPFDKDSFSRTGFPVPNNRDIVKGAALLCAELDSRNANNSEYYIPELLTHDYKVICDETNNTPESIKNNEMHVEIKVTPKEYYKPGMEFPTDKLSKQSVGRCNRLSTTNNILCTPAGIPKSIAGALCSMIPLNRDVDGSNIGDPIFMMKVCEEDGETPLGDLIYKDVKLEREYIPNVDVKECKDGYPGIIVISTSSKHMFNMCLDVNKKELTIRFFEGNKISFMQDMQFCKGLPADVTFTIYKRNKVDGDGTCDLILVAPGYGDYDNYGNGNVAIWYSDLNLTGEESFFKSIGVRPDRNIGDSEESSGCGCGCGG